MIFRYFVILLYPPALLRCPNDFYIEDGAVFRVPSFVHADSLGFVSKLGTFSKL